MLLACHASVFMFCSIWIIMKVLDASCRLDQLARSNFQIRLNRKKKLMVAVTTQVNSVCGG